MTAMLNTIDFGHVPIRKTFTDGRHYADIEVSSYNKREAFAEIRLDFRTNQPFAVMFDENWNQIM